MRLSLSFIDGNEAPAECSHTRRATERGPGTDLFITRVAHDASGFHILVEPAVSWHAPSRETQP